MKKLAILSILILLFCASTAIADTLTLPASLKEIEAEAFMGDTRLDEVILPDGLEKIGEKAFAGSSVQRIYLPESLTDIADNAFFGCENVVGYGTDGTTASQFFDSHAGLTFEREEEWVSSPVEDFTFEDNWDGTCTVTGYTGSDTKIIIPEKNGNGIDVTSIGERAFYNCSELTSIIIPESVTKIDYGAFDACSSLASIFIPKSVINIYLGSYPFNGCNSLTDINVASNNANYTSQNGALFSKDKTTLLYCPAGKTGQYEIPFGVIRIGSGAFTHCSNLTSITIPDTVISIGRVAFESCNGLNTIFIPNSVNSIEFGAFSCSNLTSINVASENKNYSSLDGVLFSKDKTTLIVYPHGKKGAYDIPYGVTSIDDYAFDLCSNLTSITIPNSVTSIGEYAFGFCHSLTSITIPNSVTSIGDSAFFFCQNLTDIDISKSVTSIGEYAFSFTNLASIVIPNGVMSIGNYAFNSCYNLTGITIPASVTSIGHDAFSFRFNIVIYGEAGSYAETFANEQNIEFSTEPMPGTEEETVLTGSFSEKAITMNIGEKKQLAGTVTSSGADIARVTLTIDGYEPEDDGSHRYSYDDFTGHHLKTVELENWEAFTLDTNKEPLNILGNYTVKLWANTTDEPNGVLLDEMVVSVVEGLSGSFANHSLTLTIGESRLISGSVTSLGGDIKRVTLTIAGYDVPDDESDRYTFDDFSGYHIKEVHLQDWAAFTLDTTRKPLDTPATYTIKLWANTVDNDHGIMLDTLTVTVENNVELIQRRVGTGSSLMTRNAAQSSVFIATSSVESVQVQYKGAMYDYTQAEILENENKRFTVALPYPDEGLNEYIFTAFSSDTSVEYHYAYWMYTPMEERAFIVVKDNADLYNVYGEKIGNIEKDELVIIRGEMNGRFYASYGSKKYFIDKDDLDEQIPEETATPTGATPTPETTNTPSSATPTPKPTTITDQPTAEPECEYIHNGVHYEPSYVNLKDIDLLAKDDGTIKVVSAKCRYCGKVISDYDIPDGLLQFSFSNTILGPKYTTDGDTMAYSPYNNYVKITIEADLTVTENIDFGGAFVDVKGSVYMKKSASNISKLKAYNLYLQSSGVTCECNDLEVLCLTVEEKAIYTPADAHNKSNVKCREAIISGTVRCDIIDCLYTFSSSFDNGNLTVEKNGKLDVPEVKIGGNFVFKSEVNQTNRFLNGVISVKGSSKIEGNQFQFEGIYKTGGYITMKNQGTNYIKTLEITTPLITVTDNDAMQSYDILENSVYSQTIKYQVMSESSVSKIRRKIRSVAISALKDMVSNAVIKNIQKATSTDELWNLFSTTQDAIHVLLSDMMEGGEISEDKCYSRIAANDSRVNPNDYVISFSRHLGMTDMNKQDEAYSFFTNNCSLFREAVAIGLLKHSISRDSISVSGKTYRITNSKVKTLSTYNYNGYQWTIDLSDSGLNINLSVNAENQMVVHGTVKVSKGNKNYDKVDFIFTTRNFNKVAQAIYEAGCDEIIANVKDAVVSLVGYATDCLGELNLLESDSIGFVKDKLNNILYVLPSPFQKVYDELSNLNGIVGEIRNQINMEIGDAVNILKHFMKYYDAAEGMYTIIP